MTEAGRALQHLFEAIHRERMRGLPMVNPALRVAAIGFEKGDYGCLGVLVTPWCMNLVLLPEGDEWTALPPGSKQLHSLPSGVYEFVVAHAPDLGCFQNCSLFSPMFEFPDQATAVATAEAALLAVMDEQHIDHVSPGQPLGHRADTAALVEHEPRLVSRRDLLRGKLFR